MPLLTSSLAKICNTVREYVETLGQESGPSDDWDVTVTIGAPGANLAASNSSNTLNLFFYRFEPGGFGPEPAPDEPWLLRLHCLVTAFGVLENQVSAGENDLRLLGEVIRVFHEKPVLDAVQVNGQNVRAQVVFQPLAWMYSCTMLAKAVMATPRPTEPVEKSTSSVSLVREG